MSRLSQSWAQKCAHSFRIFRKVGQIGTGKSKAVWTFQATTQPTHIHTQPTAQQTQHAKRTIQNKTQIHFCP